MRTWLTALFGAWVVFTPFVWADTNVLIDGFNIDQIPDGTLLMKSNGFWYPTTPSALMSLYGVTNGQSNVVLNSLSVSNLFILGTTTNQSKTVTSNNVIALNTVYTNGPNRGFVTVNCSGTSLLSAAFQFDLWVTNNGVGKHADTFGPGNLIVAGQRGSLKSPLQPFATYQVIVTLAGAASGSIIDSFVDYNY